jgi:hypothetical protein
MRVRSQNKTDFGVSRGNERREPRIDDDYQDGGFINSRKHLSLTKLPVFHAVTDWGTFI